MIAKLRKEFMERPPEEPVLQRPKPNKYLSPERRYSPPKVSSATHDDYRFWYKTNPKLSSVDKW